MTIKKDDDGCVHVNQQHYLATLGDSIDIEDDIKKYSNGKRWKIAPWDSQASTLLFGKNDEKIPIKRYQQLLGMILYAVNTRPDIQNMVTILATRQNDPRSDDYAKLVRIAWYLKKTADLGITFYPIDRINGKIQLYATADGSYDGTKGGGGRSGMTFSLGPNGTPFCCISRRQKTISLSSTEAEIKAWNHCAAIISYLINVLNTLGYKQGPVIVETDNQAAGYAVANSCITTNLLHLEPKFWYCRMLYQQRKVIFCYMGTNKLLADPLSKPLLDKVKFDRFRRRLLGEPNREDLDREIILPNKEVQKITTPYAESERV